jgi:hypothetical protein
MPPSVELLPTRVAIGSPASTLDDSEHSETLQNDACILSDDSQAFPELNSPEDSLDSDMFSISDCSDSFEEIDHLGTVYSIINKVADQLYTEFRTCAQYQSSPGNSEQNSISASDTTTPTHSSSASRPGQKRKMPRDDGDGTGEDDSCPPRVKRGNSSQDEKDQKLFACPYWKKDATAHSACSGFKLKRIRDVKSHLHRKHTPKLYCQRCLATNFPDEESLLSHISKGNCPFRNPTSWNWITHEQHNELHKKSKSNTSVENQWYKVWEVLFPGHKRPSSVYVDSDLALRVRQFHEHCAQQAPIVLVEIIESDPDWLSTNITREQRRNIMLRSIAEGINILSQNWLAGKSSASETPEQKRNGTMYDPRYETPDNSNVDTGIIMGFPPSLSEPRFQKGRLSPPTGISKEDSDFRTATTDPTAGRLALQSVDLASTSPTGAQSVSYVSLDFMDGWEERWETYMNTFDADPSNAFSTQYDGNAPEVSEDLTESFFRSGEHNVNRGSDWH